ncbi:MAG TPA: NAD(P)H-dependent oxidoreductase [Vicinamibacterales bacterium]|nr:NAD(P)H-dependent oxidoreductase [Vicinamibacterales bacterium]
MTKILAIDGSPVGGGRTRRVLDRILLGAEAAGATTSVVSLAPEESSDPIAEALSAVADADAFIFGSPVYRASYAAPLKTFLDALPRGFWGETEAPITGRAVAIAITGATWHHFLALNDLRNVLASFFGAHVLTPGLYVPAEGFSDTKEVQEPFDEFAHAQGQALCELAAAIAASQALALTKPQA